MGNLLYRPTVVLIVIIFSEIEPDLTDPAAVLNAKEAIFEWRPIQ